MIPMIVIGVIVLIIVIWLISSYNGFVTLRNKTEEAFSAMDVSLKKRYDLIPNYVETVKGYALSLIHISEPTRRTPISYAVFCLKKKKKK